MASQNRKKQRKINHIEQVEKFYIFCEGEKTEPLYFNGFKKAIQQNPIYRNIVTVEVMGTGCETLRILNCALEYIKSNKIKNSKIWCVYDKDDFSPQDFNSVPEKISSLNNSEENKKNNNSFYAAWSNECIEYWFLLHFVNYVSNNHRKYYRKILHEKFKELGWDRYEKRNEELFEIMTEKGSPKNAINYAEKQLKNFLNCTPSNSAPATKVHLLVEALAVYLPDEIKEKYL